MSILTEDILRDDPLEGIGIPAALKHALAGIWSRRIDESTSLSTLPTITR
ncbi:type II toxin-antitoxin system YoeB family toxin [Arthrobacter sp. HLT1-20]